MDALTEKLLSAKPVLKPAPDDDSDRAFVIASGSFSAAEYDAARRSVARGSLHSGSSSRGLKVSQARSLSKRLPGSYIGVKTMSPPRSTTAGSTPSRSRAAPIS